MSCDKAKAKYISGAIGRTSFDQNTLVPSSIFVCQKSWLGGFFTHNPMKGQSTLLFDSTFYILRKLKGKIMLKRKQCHAIMRFSNSQVQIT